VRARDCQLCFAPRALDGCSRDGSDLFCYGLGRREMLMACGGFARLPPTLALDGDEGCPGQIVAGEQCEETGVRPIDLGATNLARFRQKPRGLKGDANHDEAVLWGAPWSRLPPDRSPGQYRGSCIGLALPRGSQLPCSMIA
jgi:hypothetical protein